MTEEEKKERISELLKELKELQAVPKSGARCPVDISFARTGAERRPHMRHTGHWRIKRRKQMWNVS